jgi:16S rRNA C1402 N4-methylase RsmH
VKLSFREMERDGGFRIITKSPIMANYSEIKGNSKSRSAKLRIGEKYTYEQ